MRTLVLDLVGSTTGFACATATLLSGADRAVGGATWPADPRHANTRAVHEAIALITGELGGPPDSLSCLPFDPREHRADDAVLDLLEWEVAAAVGFERPIHTVVLSTRSGLRGDGSYTPLLVDEGDVARIMRRWQTTACKLGLAEPAMPRVELTVYGVPATGAAHAVGRHVGTLLFDEDLEAVRSRYPWVVPAPSAGDLALLRRVAGMVEGDEIRTYALAATKVRFDRREGPFSEVGRRWASLALDRAWRCEPVAERRAAHLAQLRRTLGEIHGVVEARGGDYDAAEEIFARICPSAGPAERSWLETTFAGDDYAVARALLLRATVANHRGDCHLAEETAGRALAAGARERSLRSTLLRLECLMVAAVAHQDRWPYEEQGNREIRAMREVALSLGRAVESYKKLYDVVAQAAGSEGTPRADRLDLGALGREGATPGPDPTLGAALGTLGRVQAFLGEHDAATRTLLLARALFATDLDRRVNAAFLAHVELDRETPNPDRLGRIVDALVPVPERGPALALGRIGAGDIGFRFTMDILLKSLAFGVPVAGAERDAWIDALIATDLFGLLRGWPSHPTELISRHAGELLLQANAAEAAARWFDLGVHAALAGGSAMRRSAIFTRQIAGEGRASPSGPRGCVHNPCYAQR